MNTPDIPEALADAAWAAAEASGQCMHDISLETIAAIVRVGMSSRTTPALAAGVVAYGAPLQSAKPIDMVLHCPACGVQHIDGAEEPRTLDPECVWTNPPHRSHLCHGCGHIWRPADVPTNGVQAIQTRGKSDHAIAPPAKLDQVLRHSSAIETAAMNYHWAANKVAIADADDCDMAEPHEKLRVAYENLRRAMGAVA